MRANRNCQWCGKPFETCGDSLSKGSWRADLCSPECFQAKIIALDFHAGNIQAEQALEMFANIGVNPKDACGVIGLDKCVKPLIQVDEPIDEIKKSKRKML